MSLCASLVVSHDWDDVIAHLDFFGPPISASEVGENLRNRKFENWYSHRVAIRETTWTSNPVKCCEWRTLVCKNELGFYQQHACGAALASMRPLAFAWPHADYGLHEATCICEAYYFRDANYVLRALRCLDFLWFGWFCNVSFYQKLKILTGHWSWSYSNSFGKGTTQSRCHLESSRQIYQILVSSSWICFLLQELILSSLFWVRLGNDPGWIDLVLDPGLDRLVLIRIDPKRDCPLRPKRPYNYRELIGYSFIYL